QVTNAASVCATALISLAFSPFSADEYTVTWTTNASGFSIDKNPIMIKPSANNLRLRRV
ncbi:uncharacterized, partial [Tachysurus ichikawai]